MSYMISWYGCAENDSIVAEANKRLRAACAHDGVIAAWTSLTGLQRDCCCWRHAATWARMLFRRLLLRHLDINKHSAI